MDTLGSEYGQWSALAEGCFTELRYSVQFPADSLSPGHGHLFTLHHTAVMDTAPTLTLQTHTLPYPNNLRRHPPLSN
jgi:hypothetical protein